MERGAARPDHGGMSADTTKDMTNATDAERAAAKREERQGWLLLTAIFVGGGIVVAIAAMAT